MEQIIWYQARGELGKWGTCVSDWTKNLKDAYEYFQKIYSTHENPRIIKRTEEVVEYINIEGTRELSPYEELLAQADESAGQYTRLGH